MGSTGAYRALCKFGSIGALPLALQEDDLDGDTDTTNILRRLTFPIAPDQARTFPAGIINVCSYRNWSLGSVGI